MFGLGILIGVTLSVGAMVGGYFLYKKFAEKKIQESRHATYGHLSKAWWKVFSDMGSPPEGCAIMWESSKNGENQNLLITIKLQEATQEPVTLEKGEVLASKTREVSDEPVQDDREDSPATDDNSSDD